MPSIASSRADLMGQVARFAACIWRSRA